MANWFRLSAVAGLLCTIVIELYRLLSLDPVLFTRLSTPAWIVDVRFVMLAGSVAVYLYGVLIERLQKQPLWLVLLALTAQWGLPLNLVFDERSSQLASPYRFLSLVSISLHFVVIVGIVWLFVREPLVSALGSLPGRVRWMVYRLYRWLSGQAHKLRAIVRGIVDRVRNR